MLGGHFVAGRRFTLGDAEGERAVALLVVCFTPQPIAG
jgi:hypothetical protein